MTTLSKILSGAAILAAIATGAVANEQPKTLEFNNLNTLKKNPEFISYFINENSKKCEKTLKTISLLTGASLKSNKHLVKYLEELYPAKQTATFYENKDGVYAGMLELVGNKKGETLSLMIFPNLKSCEAVKSNYYK